MPSKIERRILPYSVIFGSIERQPRKRYSTSISAAGAESFRRGVGTQEGRTMAVAQLDVGNQIIAFKRKLAPRHEALKRAFADVI